MNRIRLGLNIDHVATVRNARGGNHPDPVRAADMAINCGVDGITAHLREDRRHIRDEDMKAIQALCEQHQRPLNFEMAVTDEMLQIALNTLPHAVCLVPEHRQERTTEGGLDVLKGQNRIGDAIAQFTRSGVRTSLFIATDPEQIKVSAKLKAPVVEFHTGAMCDAARDGNIDLYKVELERLRLAAKLAHDLGIEVHAGHGIDFTTVEDICRIPEIKELNIGHFLIGEAIFTGLAPAILKIRALMDQARGL